MASTHVQKLLMGVASGVAGVAAALGLMLLLVAVVADMRADAAAVLVQHPMFVAGKELILASLLVAVPLGALWWFQRRA